MKRPEDNALAKAGEPQNVTPKKDDPHSRKPTENPSLMSLTSLEIGADHQPAEEEKSSYDFQKGDLVEIVKQGGTTNGQKAWIIEPEWHGLVKVIMEYTECVKSYLPEELKIVE